MLEIRPASSEDETFLYELYASTRAEEMKLWAWDERTAESFLRMQFAAQSRSYREQYPELRLRIVTVNGDRAGRISTCRLEKALLVVDLSLLPAFRGQGIGQRLMEAVQREASDLRLPVRLRVAKGNPAKRLYERLGFQTTADDGVYEQMEWHAS
ncbi:GNAT family N-acetyltransferase [Paenibacillus humicola]|uniref:GNAT family N-acetyltransferase n=1 Tax=Paenibacillus humicola TaxID=3110540 RepID=UPI00237A419A|nr:GNAT family N-acetyltransferase [Paenibacillus humicola]